MAWHLKLNGSFGPRGHAGYDGRHRVEVGGGGAEGDQHVHVSAAVGEGLVRARVVAVADPELDRRRQQPP